MKANAQPEIVTKNGKPVSVILPIKKYQEMLERLEDAADVAWLKRARRKKLHFRPLEEVLADLPTRQAMYRVVVERSAEKGPQKTPARSAFPRR
jgi:antitoxin (DNA-binding transcriptional repressor) of toxin-antitoxin stability system